MQTSSVLFLIVLLCTHNIDSLSLKRRHLDPTENSIQIKSITIDLIHPEIDIHHLQSVYTQVEQLLTAAKEQQERHTQMYIEKQKQCKVEQVQKQALVEADSAIIEAAKEARKECTVTQEELIKKKQEIEFKVQDLEGQIKMIGDAIDDEDMVKEMNINFGILIKKIMEFLEGEVKTMDVFLEFDWLERAKNFVKESKENGEAEDSETIKIGGLNIKGDLKFKDGKLKGSLDWFRDGQQKEEEANGNQQEQLQFPQQLQQQVVHQQPIVQEPIVQQPIVQEPIVQEPIVQEPQQPIVQEPIVQEPQQPIVQEPIVQEPVVQEPQQPIVQEPVVQEPQHPSEVPFEQIPEIQEIEEDNKSLFQKLLSLLQTLAVDINLYKAGLIKYDVFQKKLYSLKTLFESAKDSLEQQIAEIDEEILETVVCIDHQNKIIDQNYIHVENNQQLHNASVDHCLNFEEEFKKQSQERAENVHKLGEALAVIRERMDELPEKVLGKYKMTMEYFKNAKVPIIHINKYLN